MKLTINTESAAASAITAMVHSAGTSEIYINTLSRLYKCVLHNQEDLGMDDTEAIDTLRTLDLLKSDIQDISTDKDLKSALLHVEEAETDIMEDPEDQCCDHADPIGHATDTLRRAMYELADTDPRFKEIADTINTVSCRFKEITTTKSAER